MDKIKINILSPGRFIVLDLARELDKNGYDVKFYSYVPNRRVKKFGLPVRCNVSFLVILAPLLYIAQLFPRYKLAKRLRRWLQDTITSIFMRKCDVLISMSGEFTKANKRAKKEGSLFIIERGSMHILEQKRILENIPSLAGKKPVPDENVRKELLDYELADFISVASLHVRDSLIKYGIPQDRIFVNPYGVDLKMFSPVANRHPQYDIVMIGQWSYRKGCDLILDAVLKKGYRLLHIGSIIDVELIDNINITHITKVDITELGYYINQAKTFVLPSREEGMALVQAEAIACNIPLVGSPNSGAIDLQKMVECPQYISVISEYSTEALIDAIEYSLSMYDDLININYAGGCIRELTWSAYGRRYVDFLEKIIK